MASDVARFLSEKYSKSLSEIGRRLPASISRRFGDIRDNTTTPSISSLYDLLDVLAEWRIFKEQHKGIVKNFRRLDLVRRTNDLLYRIEGELKTKKAVNQAEGSSSSQTLSQTRSASDRFTFYEPDYDPSDIVGFYDQEMKMVNWLLASGEGLKSMGIYGMGGSGKTTLVKKVLINPEVRATFKHNIIWACLSDLTCENDIDIKIAKYLLDCLGFDADGLGNRVVDKDRLMKRLEQLLDVRKYVIVFDDVWYCNDSFIELCNKLATRGAVIVTSRIKEVAEPAVNPMNLIHLSPLDDEKEIDIFRKAFVLLDTSMESQKN